MATLYNRNGIWWCAISKNGKRQFTSLKTKSKKEAQQRLAEIQGETNNLSVYELFEYWLDNHDVQPHLQTDEINISQKTIDSRNAYERIVQEKIDQFCKIAGNKPAHKIDRNFLNNYMSTLYNFDYATNTISMAMRHIKVVFSFAFQNDLIPTNPFKGVKIPSTDSRKEYFTYNELNEFYSVVDRPLILAYFKFMVNSGIRVSEASNLKWSDFKDHYIVLNGKEGERTFPRWQSIEPYIDDIKRLQEIKSEQVFISENGSDLLRWHALTKLFKKYLKECSFYEKKPDLVLYSLRHTFATLHILNGASIYDVSKWLGHKSVTTTEKYYDHVISTMRGQPARML